MSILFQIVWGALTLTLLGFAVGAFCERNMALGCAFGVSASCAVYVWYFIRKHRSASE